MSARSSGEEGSDRAQQVRDFYEHQGWVATEGQLGEARIFGPREDGRIRVARDQARARRVGQLLAGAQRGSLVEFGGGGQPAAWLMGGFDSYTGVDFSRRGLDVAAELMQRRQIEASFVEADVRSLPLPDAAFDAGFSAHMIYHLPERDDQLSALKEMARVVRPGGVLAVVAANPYPWLFPGRILRRMVANAPGVGAAVDKLRRSPPLPYLPLSPRWMADVLAAWGDTEILPFDMASVWFGRHVSERRTVGRLAWKVLNHVESTWPRLARWGGCYVLVVLRKL
jgi:SAM-dependent methyltransferase